MIIDLIVHRAKPLPFQAEAAERKRILGQAYSLILSWGDKRKKGNASINTRKVQESKTVGSGAISIPHGKYLTIAQVTEICSVREKPFLIG